MQIMNNVDRKETVDQQLLRLQMHLLRMLSP